MRRTQADAHDLTLEAFELAVSNAKRSGSDLPSAPTLLRAIRLYSALARQKHDGDIEVFVAEDGSLELTAFAADAQLLVEVSDDSLELLIKRISTSVVLVSETRATDRDVERWLERAA